MSFQITALNVLMLVALAIPGYLLVKFKLLKPEVNSSIAIFLLYVCQPALSLYSFQQATYSKELFKNISIVFIASFIFQIIIIFIGYLIFKKNYDNPKNRVCIFAGACGNVGFFGVPILQALLPENPEAVIYSAIFIVSMNIISWTLGMFILSRDKKYMSFKKMIFNPPILILIVALPLFFTKTVLPEVVMTGVTFFAKASTPLAMTILGMRFACVNLKELFLDAKQYVAIAIKLVIFPLLAYLLLLPFDMDPVVHSALFILSAMPPAAISLNFCEVLDIAPKTAANIVLLGSLLCIITLPLLMLLP